MKNKTILGLICLFTLGLAACPGKTEQAQEQALAQELAPFRPVIARIAPNRIVAGATTINFEVSVVNTGTEASPTGATLQVYRSTNADISVEDDRTPIGTTDQSITTIAVGGEPVKADAKNELLTTELATVEIGAQYYGACLSIPSAEAEVDPTVICSRGVKLSIVEAADLGTAAITIYENAPSINPESVPAGIATTVTLGGVSVINEGDAPLLATNEMVSFYSSATEGIDIANDMLLTAPASMTLPILNAGEKYTLLDGDLSATVSGGDTIHYGACLSGVLASDDCTATVALTAPEPQTANVTLPTDAPTLDPVSVTANTATDVTLTPASVFTNEGDVDSSDTGVVVTFYSSPDASIDTGDTVVGTAVTLPMIGAQSTRYSGSCCLKRRDRH